MVCRYYYTNVAARLQNIESRIANLLMLRLSTQNIVVLPIHDGFIVQAQHETELRNEMLASFRTITDGQARIPSDLLETQDQTPLDFDTHFDQYSQYYERRQYHEEDS